MNLEFPTPDPFDMPKTYDFRAAEDRLYRWWEQNGWFKPEAAGPDAEPFVIAIPPPNVTGSLHQGHALFVTIEDLMIRYQRMRGRAALWIPGTDHAGIATQLQVERKLREEGTSREAIGRERFLEEAWAWKNKYHGRIVGQLRRMGASCDWDRERFTLDEGLSRAVIEAFVRLYRMGLIYRSEYIINWSPGLQTAVSDLEVEYSEEQGTLYYFKYPIAGHSLDEGPGKGYIPVATTRPETILADTAVAVHPDDERYRHLIGSTCLVPILNRPIPVIHDTYVSMEFGTGALKITPGHDPSDFEIGQRHGLPIVNIMNKDATLNEHAGPYAGMDRFAARQKLWEDMAAAGLVIKEEPYTMTVPRAQRGGEIIEPLVSNQWFVNTKPMAELGLAAVRTGRIKIVPERFTKVYYHWLENLRPWCISRQLWWGHRIPAWYGPDGQVFVARSEAEALAAAAKHYGRPTPLEQDPDVLDTWFSSALWPFSTLGWPDDTPDLRRYYPTDVMETGYDILFFWVARMIMTGLLFTNDIPFHTVYLHGLVRDEHGRKMSKTFNNVIDPIEVMDEFGADALRFTLLTGSTPGNDMNLSVERIRANRNFANKIWNAARFTVTNLGKLASSGTGDQSSAPTARRPAATVHRSPATDHRTLADRWILSRLSATVAEVTRLFEAYQYGEAGRQAYEFLWGEFADWYIEIAKGQLAAGGEQAWRTAHILVHVLDQTLRLLHPFIPFVTEDIWQNLRRAAQAAGLPYAWPEALIIAAWPEPGEADPAAEADFGRVQEIVRAVRNARAEYNVPPGRRIGALISAGDHLALVQQELPVIAALAGLDPAQVTLGESLPAPAQSIALVAGGVTVSLPLADLVDLEAELARLRKELANAEKMAAGAAARLANPGFVNSAPPAVVEGARKQLAEWEAKKAQLQERLAMLQGQAG
ncbi:MAG: valine--tRNA ligase [Caldilineales bacterium]|nr:valine--tRNA ligase [Caldilineales bacterium]MDW8317504.1 valine--tRNA ligase [Anaerolineae bacterium]